MNKNLIQIVLTFFISSLLAQKLPLETNNYNTALKKLLKISTLVDYLVPKACFLQLDL